jgi:hypothetical protein
MDQTHNAKGICRSLTSLLKICPNDMGSKKKLVSPQFHVMFDDNFDAVQQPDTNIKLSDKMDSLFKTNNYKQDDPFSNEHTYLFSYGGVDIHPDTLSPNIKRHQESMMTSSTGDETNFFALDKASDEITTITDPYTT